MPLDQTPNADLYANHIPAAVRRASQLADDMAREAGMTGAPVADPVVVDPLVVEPPVVDPVVVVQPQTPTDDWEQKYRTLQGKYDAEIPGLRQQVQSLERVIAAIQQPTPTPARTPPANTTVVVPAEDVENFGEDLVAASRRWARAEMETTIADLKATVDGIKAQYGQLETSQRQSVQMTAQQSVMAGMDAHPVHKGTWRTVNDSPAFLAWLNDADTFSGQQRLQLLRDAYTGGNTPRVAAFFDAYTREQTGQQVPATPAAHTPAPGTGGPTLEDLAAPGRGSGPTPPGAQPDKRVWSSPQITAFYRDVQRGVFNGREAEKARLESDIISAATEGRVR